MAIIKKTSFEDLYNAMSTVCKKIDEQFTEFKKNNKGKKIYYGFLSYKEFLRNIELAAIKETAIELDLGETTVRDRWRIMSLPLPVYSALENNEAPFSRFKPLTNITFDIENDKDTELAQKMVDEIKKDISLDDIKALVKKEAVNIWNSKDILMEMFARQNGVSGSMVA